MTSHDTKWSDHLQQVKAAGRLWARVPELATAPEPTSSQDCLLDQALGPIESGLVPALLSSPVVLKRSSVARSASLEIEKSSLMEGQ